MAEKLSPEAHKAALDEMTKAGWAHDAGRDALTKTFQFEDFVEAFGWMSQMAIRAEKLNHHPEWSNVYRTVEVLLTTHDVDGLSELDLKLARAMDKAAG
ncbi:MAG: 4a-hydroxytetrahydrobiopterin dehydratase [Pseudomonadota bacterium]